MGERTPPTTEAVAQHADAAFRTFAGRAPDGIWAAPGRLNLIGEHTDYNDGFVLPIAIDRVAVAALGIRTDGRIRMRSLQERDAAELRVDDIGPGRPRGWSAYAAGVTWSLRREHVRVAGFDLVIDSAVPVASGLSSSAALECAVALGLSELAGADLDRPSLATAAQRAEVEVVGVPCGVMDQMASLLGRRDHALFLDTRGLTYDHIPVRTASSGLAIVAVDTRAPRRLVDGAYADRRSACRAAAAALGVPTLRDVSIDELTAARGRLDARLFRRARHVVTENARVLEFVGHLEAGRASALGPLLTASHASLRDDFEVSSPELDAAVDAALGAGALGARMTGAGFGGCALALVSSDLVPALVDGLTRAFAARGYPAPEAFTVIPAAGARRLR